MNREKRSLVAASESLVILPKHGLPSREETAGLPLHRETHSEPTKVNRRTLLELMAASTALALGSGCDRKPPRKIVSLRNTPEYQHPGQPLYYASTWTDGLTPYGIVAKTVDGRPVKIEGLPEHPLNEGAASAAMQASLLSLYDPERLREPRDGGAATSWDAADEKVVAALREAKSVALITRSTLGPAERGLVAEFLAAKPGARHFVHETVHDGNRRDAWATIHGEPGEWRPRLDRAYVVLGLDCDFLGMDGDVLRNTRDFAASRSVEAVVSSRLYQVESSLSITGSNADHRLALRPSAILDAVQALRAAERGDEAPLRGFAEEQGVDETLLLALARDLAANRGRAVVLAGAHLPASVHAAVTLLNESLEAPGNTLDWNPRPSTALVSHPRHIGEALAEGVDVVITLGVNPVYDWPGGDGAKLFEQAKLVVSHGLYLDETLASADLALPSHHNFESWNDAAPLAGVQTLCQPVISPLFDTRQEAHSLQLWTRALEGSESRDDWHDYVKARWEREVLPEGAAQWEGALRDGLFGEATQDSPPAVQRERAEQLIATQSTPAGDFEVVVFPHHAVLDGRWSHVSWLQELPEPVTKLVWDNAALISPATAKALSVVDGDRIRVRVGERTAELPVLILPGVAGNVMVTTLGYGRVDGNPIGSGKGFATAALLGPNGERHAPAARVERASDSAPYPLVRTQKHFSMEGRPIVLRGTRAEYDADPAFVDHRLHHLPDSQLHGEFDYSKGSKWATALDLNKCVGCSACVTACQSENNTPVVGKEECDLGREMHWIRLDTYIDGPEENLEVAHQPMMCQHCDNAPCESVCPVNATAHSPEGLNEQAYNRCIGTRYCANNCPYKVRRFNFYNYTGWNHKDPVQELAQNPQVTVRSRGVMEKCTFCIQRINEVKFKAKNEGVPIPDGAIQPACQQTCPADAIVFGDVNDPESKIARLVESPRSYSVLGELNVRPNVNYLARVVNPNPAVPRVEDGSDEDHARADHAKEAGH